MDSWHDQRRLLEQFRNAGVRVVDPNDDEMHFSDAKHINLGDFTCTAVVGTVITSITGGPGEVALEYNVGVFMPMLSPTWAIVSARVEAFIDLDEHEVGEFVKGGWTVICRRVGTSARDWEGVVAQYMAGIQRNLEEYALHGAKVLSDPLGHEEIN